MIDKFIRADNKLMVSVVCPTLCRTKSVSVLRGSGSGMLEQVDGVCREDRYGTVWTLVKQAKTVFEKKRVWRAWC